jgi:hypothetical protein
MKGKTRTLIFKAAIMEGGAISTYRAQIKCARHPSGANAISRALWRMHERGILKRADLTPQKLTPAEKARVEAYISRHPRASAVWVVADEYFAA